MITEKKIKLLILTNMGATSEKPYSGIFVRNQWASIKDIEGIDAKYCEMPDFSRSKRLLGHLRYPNFMLYFVFKHILRRHSYDIIHIHFFFPTILLAILYKIVRKPNCKIVITFHGSDIYSYAPFGWFYLLCTKFIDYAIFVSADLKNRLKLKVAQQVLSAGILSVFQPDKQVVIEKKYDLIFVGNLTFNKGADRLLNLLIDFKRPMTVCIVGVGEYTSAFQSLNTIHHIYVFGAMTPLELKKLYQQSRYLINLSRFESFGLVMTEAMACGTPIICTDTDGSASQLDDLENGFLVKQNTVNFEHDLAKLIENALSCKTVHYDALSSSAIKHSAKYSITKITESLNKVYRELVH